MLLQRTFLSILLSLAFFASLNVFMGEAKAQFFWEKIEAEQRRKEGLQPAPSARPTQLPPNIDNKVKRQAKQNQPPAPPPPRGLFQVIEQKSQQAQKEQELLEKLQAKQAQRRQPANQVDPIQAQRQQIAPGLPQTAYREQEAPQRGGGFFDWLLGAPKENVVRSFPAENQRSEEPVFLDPDELERNKFGSRMVCVRTCDGAFMPISTGLLSASQRNYDLCGAQCPGAEMKVFRMNGEHIENAISQDGEKYMSLANALKFRNSFDKACSCRPQGKSWAEYAAGHEDPTMRKGDSVLTSEQAKRMGTAPALRNATPREDLKAKPAEAVAVTFDELVTSNAKAANNGQVRIIQISPARVQSAQSETPQPLGLNPVEKLLLERNIKRSTPIKSGVIEQQDKRG